MGSNTNSARKSVMGHASSKSSKRAATEGAKARRPDKAPKASSRGSSASHASKEDRKRAKGKEAKAKKAKKRARGDKEVDDSDSAESAESGKSDSDGDDAELTETDNDASGASDDETNKSGNEESDGDDASSSEEEEEEEEESGEEEASGYTPHQLKRRRVKRANLRAKTKGYRKLVKRAGGGDSRRVTVNVLTLGEVVRMAKNAPAHENKPAYDSYEEFSKRAKLSNEGLSYRPACVIRSAAESLGRQLTKDALRLSHQQNRTRITAADVRHAARGLTRATTFGNDAPLGILRMAQTSMIKKQEKVPHAPNSWRWVEGGYHLPTWDEDKSQEHKEWWSSLIKKQKECAQSYEELRKAKKYKRDENKRNAERKKAIRVGESAAPASSSLSSNI